MVLVQFSLIPRIPFVSTTKFRLSIVSETAVPFSMRLYRDSVPFRIRFKSPSFTSIPWRMEFAVYDIPRATIRLVIDESTMVELFDGSSIEVEPYGLRTATLYAESSAAIGSPARVVLNSGYDVDLFVGRVVRVSWNASDRLWVIVAKDVIHSGTSDEVPIRGEKTHMQELLDAVAALGGLCLADRVSETGRSFAATGSSIPISLLAMQVCALLNARFSAENDGSYVLRGSYYKWTVTDSIALDFSAEIQATDYANVICVACEEEWEVPAVRRKVTTQIPGGTLTVDREGDRIHSSELLIGSWINQKTENVFDGAGILTKTTHTETPVRSTTVYESIFIPAMSQRLLSKKSSVTKQIDSSGYQEGRDYDTKTEIQYALSKTEDEKLFVLTRVTNKWWWDSLTTASISGTTPTKPGVPDVPPGDNGAHLYMWDGGVWHYPADFASMLQRTDAGIPVGLRLAMVDKDKNNVSSGEIYDFVLHSLRWHIEGGTYKSASQKFGKGGDVSIVRIPDYVFNRSSEQLSVKVSWMVQPATSGFYKIFGYEYNFRFWSFGNAIPNAIPILYTMRELLVLVSK